MMKQASTKHGMTRKIILKVSFSLSYVCLYWFLIRYIVAYDVDRNTTFRIVLYTCAAADSPSARPRLAYWLRTA